MQGVGVPHPRRPKRKEKKREENENNNENYWSNSSRENPIPFRPYPHPEACRNSVLYCASKLGIIDLFPSLSLSSKLWHSIISITVPYPPLFSSFDSICGIHLNPEPVSQSLSHEHENTQQKKKKEKARAERNVMCREVTVVRR